jgi:transcription termination factor NusB
MRFKQYENGSCDLEFTWKERLILFRKGKIHFSDESFKNFSNTLMKMVMDWSLKFDENIKKHLTNPDKDKINGE